LSRFGIGYLPLFGANWETREKFSTSFYFLPAKTPKALDVFKGASIPYKLPVLPNFFSQSSRVSDLLRRIPRSRAPILAVGGKCGSRWCASSSPNSRCSYWTSLRTIWIPPRPWVSSSFVLCMIRNKEVLWLNRIDPESDKERNRVRFERKRVSLFPRGSRKRKKGFVTTIPILRSLSLMSEKVRME